jgi:AmmeMemoRadiSam system protein A
MGFHLEIRDTDKAACKELARFAIAQRLGIDLPRPDTSAPLFAQQYGAFVTIKRQGQLRGCIGNVSAATPLAETIERMAQAAAFEDPRFPPLGPEELAEVELEISILGPITPCPDPELVEVGRHGLMVRRGFHSGLLLPQVAVEWGWDRETFLDHTCLKAGLPRGCWKKPRVELWWFEAVVF